MITDDISSGQHVKLSPKQDAFAKAIADGMTQADAYRSAYNVKKMADNSIWINASKLMADAKVKLRVAYLKDLLVQQDVWSREDSVKILAEIAKDLDARRADRISAIKEINVMHGFNAPSKHELTGADGAPLAIQPTVIQIVGIEPGSLNDDD